MGSHDIPKNIIILKAFTRDTDVSFCLVFLKEDQNKIYYDKIKFKIEEIIL
jgi:hypothetical protein